MTNNFQLLRWRFVFQRILINPIWDHFREAVHYDRPTESLNDVILRGVNIDWDLRDRSDTMWSQINFHFYEIIIGQKNERHHQIRLALTIFFVQFSQKLFFFRNLIYNNTKHFFTLSINVLESDKINKLFFYLIGRLNISVQGLNVFSWKSTFGG